MSRLIKSFMLLAALWLAPGLHSLAAPDSANAVRRSTMQFREMGAFKPIELRGVEGNANFPFGVRLDEVVTRAKLSIEYTLSPALLPDVSHVKVYLNDDVLATIPVTKENTGMPKKLELALDGRHFTDFNKLRLQLIGHYTKECEFPYHTSLWANISQASTLELELKPVALKNDLALLPAPFFDHRDNRQLKLPFVFAAKPSLDTLRAAGGLASWFGALASYRGARFPTHLNALPERHGIVFATNAERPDFLSMIEKVEAPTISLITHPSNPTGKLLLILGRDAADLKIAADALALGKASLSGPSVTVKSLDYPAKRAAYDAPNWLQPGRPVPLGELVGSPADLQRKGYTLDPIRVNVRLPADLFTWGNKGLPLDLKYRYSQPADEANASLNIELNNEFVESLPLTSANGSKGKNRITLPVMEDGFVRDISGVMLPAFLLGSNNQLQFSFYLPTADSGHCRTVLPPDMRGSIDPDSTLDISGMHHYAAMPNLGFFASSGYPFTKYADLAETAVVLPEQHGRFEIETMLTMLGHMGRSTGFPGLHFKLVSGNAAKQLKDADLLLIDSGGIEDLSGLWGKSLPAMIDAAKRTFSSISKPLDMAYEWFGLAPKKTAAPAANSVLLGSGPLAAFMGFESPSGPSRSVVVVSANAPEALPIAIDGLLDNAKVTSIRGDLTLLRGEQVESFRVNDVYYVGRLPWWSRAWFHLQNYPLLLTIAGIAVGLFIALALFAMLRARAARRLSEPKQ
ncbi:MAG: cellulose synthase [Burkholderiaceae bacterium]|nr:cellulose synthase [Burkholderiaceae bacterium]